MNMRALADVVSQLVGRARLANIAGRTFRGKRDIYKALGYQRELFVNDYRSRFERNAVANRIVKAMPKATWRTDVQVIEDEDPAVETVFEAAWADLVDRLKIWDAFQKADILAGIGRFGVLLIGAPGKMEEPLLSATADDIKYLQPYSEEDCKVYQWDIDPKSPRFGRPLMYNLTRTTMLSPESVNSNVVAKQVHWTRIVHIADSLLDDNVYGEPRLRCVWNLLDDLEKVSGGGAEAFWRRADGGTQFDLDPTVEFDDEDDAVPASTSTTPAKSSTADMKKQLDEMEHGFRRNLLTRGVTMTRMGSDVADFQAPVNALISLISAGTGIPQRVLMGSEQGKLAAKQDRANWDNRAADRQNDWAEPCVIRPFVDRFIALGVLPVPVDGYDVRWSAITTMDDEQRAGIAKEWAALNQATGETVVTPDEIRVRVLNLPPLKDAGQAATVPLAASARKGEAPVHAVADRFRPTRPSYRQRLLRRREARVEPEQIGTGDQDQKRTRGLDSNVHGLDHIREALDA